MQSWTKWMTTRCSVYPPTGPFNKSLIHCTHSRGKTLCWQQRCWRRTRPQESLPGPLGHSQGPYSYLRAPAQALVRQLQVWCSVHQAGSSLGTLPIQGLEACRPPWTADWLAEETQGISKIKVHSGLVAHCAYYEHGIPLLFHRTVKDSQS